MIQRIQTLFLLATVILTGLLFCMPVADFMAPNGVTYQFYAHKVTEITPEGVRLVAHNIYSMILTIVATILPLATIFLYKKQLTQIRFCIVEVILQAGLLFLLWLQCNSMMGETDSETLFKIALSFPMVNVILSLLAIQRIGKDIALLKSYDRIR